MIHYVYIRDGWSFPLSSALRLLIEISSESFWEKAIYSLELATLEDVADIGERSTFAQAGIDGLLKERSGKLLFALCRHLIHEPYRVESIQTLGI